MDVKTKIDQMIDIIAKHKEISVKKLSTLLEVSEEVVMEWAKILEEKGVISIKYKFTMPILCIERIDKSLKIEREIELKEKKNIYLRKIDILLEKIELEKRDLEKAKERYEKVKRELSKKIGSIDEDFKLIEKLENEKMNLRKILIENKKKEIANILSLIFSEKKELKKELLDLERSLKKLKKLQKEYEKLKKKAKLLKRKK